MSHFAVLVVSEDGESLDEQLAPFYEQVEQGSEYAEFEDKTDEYREEYETGTVEQVKVGKEWLYAWQYQREVEEKKKPGGLNAVDRKFSEIYKSFEDFCEQYHGTSANDNGEYGYWHNPNAKWDWWQLGGRWSGFFLKKRGAQSGVQGEKSWTNEKLKLPAQSCDSIVKKDIDISAMKKERVKSAKITYAEAQKMEGPTREFIYGVKVNETEEEYVKRCADRHPCQTFAVLFRGEWIERGSMGWWGVVSNEKDANDWNAQFERIWKKIPADATISVVDCHI